MLCRPREVFDKPVEWRQKLKQFVAILEWKLVCCNKKKHGRSLFIGVLRHMQRYFSRIHVCDGTDLCTGGLKKELYLRSGSQRNRHFAGFFNVPALHRHETTLFKRWFRHTAPFSRLLRHARDTEDVFSTYLPASSRGSMVEVTQPFRTDYYDRDDMIK